MPNITKLNDDCGRIRRHIAGEFDVILRENLPSYCGRIRRDIAGAGKGQKTLYQLCWTHVLLAR